jgi:hypothetical protein
MVGSDIFPPFEICGMALAFWTAVSLKIENSVLWLQ